MGISYSSTKTTTFFPVFLCSFLINSSNLSAIKSISSNSISFSVAVSFKNLLIDNSSFSGLLDVRLPKSK